MNEEFMLSTSLYLNYQKGLDQRCLAFYITLKDRVFLNILFHRSYSVKLICFSVLRVSCF